MFEMQLTMKNSTASNFNLQYCEKVMQTNFDEIRAFRGFSRQFRLKRNLFDNSPHFCDIYCLDTRELTRSFSLCAVIRRELSSDNLRTFKRRFESFRAKFGMM